MSGVLVVAEVRQGAVRDISLELLAAGAELAEQGAGPLRVLIVADDPARHGNALNVPGVEEVLTVTSPLENFEAHLQAQAVSEAIAAVEPAIVLAGHTVDSMGFAAAVAARLDLGFASDVVSLAFGDSGLTARRGSYGGRLVATIEFPGRDRVMALVRPGVYEAPVPGGGTATVRDAGITLDAAQAATEHLGYIEADGGDVDITKADFLLAIGRGVEEESDVEKMMEVAEAIGATLVSSRPLVDAGWLPASRQVGQSGRTVTPKVYLAFGISGAVQHLMGMRKSQTIIAVNTNASAPIFSVADFGAVADLHDVSDALAEAFGRS
jgi:electron transfer flavoprotein alpha subunit